MDNNAKDQLFGAIEALTEKVVNATPIDVTVVVTIVQVINVEIGLYRVRHKKDTMEARSLDVLTVYSKGEEVYMLVPQGRFENPKLILGHARHDRGTSFADRHEITNQWRARGPNWLSPQWYWRQTSGAGRPDLRDQGIVAIAPEEITLISAPVGNPPFTDHPGQEGAWRGYLFERTVGPYVPPREDENWSNPVFQARARRAAHTMNEDWLSRVDGFFQNYSDRMEHFQVQATFETRFAAVHTGGEYGLQIECWVTNPRYGSAGYEDDPPYLLATFRFKCFDFTGNPYGLNTPIRQRATFAVPRGALRGLVRVSLYQDDGFITDVTPRVDEGDPTLNAAGEWSRPPSIIWDVNHPTTPAQRQTTANNIIVKDVDIRWVEPMNLFQQGYWIRIIPHQGTHVWNEVFSPHQNPETLLEARLMFGDQDITSEESCKFVWFREKLDASVVQTSRSAVVNDQDEFGYNWHDYAGPRGDQDGWAPIAWDIPDDNHRVGLGYQPRGTVGGPPNSVGNFFGQWLPASVLGTGEGMQRNYVVSALNQFMGIDSGLNLLDRRVEFNCLRVPVERVPWRWRYRVACLYNGVPRIPGARVETTTRYEVKVWAEETIYNAGSPWDFEIPDPRTGMGIANTFLRVRNNEHAWQDNEYYTFDEIEPPLHGLDWWNRWWVRGPFGLHRATYGMESQYQEGKFNINPFLIHESLFFSAQVYAPVRAPFSAAEDPAVSQPSGRTWPGIAGENPDFNEYPLDWPTPRRILQHTREDYIEIANVHISLLQPGDAPFLVEFSGPTQFNYNADGTLKRSSVNNTLEYLKAHVRWRSGYAGTYSIDWYSPEGNVLTQPNSPDRFNEDVGQMDERSMMFGMWIGSRPGDNPNNFNTVNYRVRDTFYMDRDQNTYRLRITLFDGREFYFDKEIFFIKDGDQGTHGSAWVARIQPTNSGNNGVGGDGLLHPQWSQRLAVPRPLVLNGNLSSAGWTLANNDGAPHVMRDGRNIPRFPHLWVRPFITKNGQKFEHLPSIDQYTARIFWDTTYGPSVWDRNDCDNMPRAHREAWNMSPIVLRDSFGNLISGNTRPGDPANPHLQASAPGTRGITNWNPFPDPTSGGAGGFHPGLRVDWNPAFPPELLRELNFAAVIQAQIDIYRQGERIATIFSYWPVDLLFLNGSTDIVPAEVETNWPQFVNYDAAGYNPQAQSNPLVFYYGEYRNNQDPPLPTSAVPINMNTRLAEIDVRRDRDGAIVSRNWLFAPRAHFLADDGFYGAIRTEIDAAALAGGDFTGWVAGAGHAVWVRPQVFRLVTHGNSAINAWDGRSISMVNDVILAPTVGAGWKHPYTNTFSGVLMGINTAKHKRAYNDIWGGFGVDDLNESIGNRFMTGLFGYQNGVSSFGIMENGVAYFGRADRGRIVIDGVNAQIYGGASKRSGVNDPTDIGSDAHMPMFNRMRLSFIDFNGGPQSASHPRRFSYGEAPGGEGGGGVPNTVGHTMYNTPGPNIDGCNDVNINTGPLTIDIAFAQYFNWAWIGGGEHNSPSGYASLDSPEIRARGFGAGHGYVTPAIEVGQYRRNDIETMVRALTVCEVRGRALAGRDHLLNRLHIPGYRRFLVTYDGTMYAMNAFIKGNLIGSNIIGSQFFNWDGSFAVTERGNLGIGISTDGGELGHPGDWTASSVRGGFREAWSNRVPWIEEYPVSTYIERDTDGEANRNDFLGLGCDGENNGQAFNFFVTNQGRVIARDLHVQGGSLNIGHFYIVGNEWDNSGDVVSFGTMYLVGREPGTAGDTHDGDFRNALEAWGNVYFRGTLSNLGNVFLGSSIEKNTKDPGPSHPPTSMNSPIAIVPSPGPLGVVQDAPIPDPATPTWIGVWPMFARVGWEQDIDTNNTWFGLSTGTGENTDPDQNPAGTQFMPDFSVRTEDEFYESEWDVDQGAAVLSDQVVFRVDQLGLWTDGAIWTSHELIDGEISDAEELTFEDHGLAYAGWWDIGGVWAFAIKNASAQAPALIMETPADLRLSSGKYSGARGGAIQADANSTSAIILESWGGFDGEIRRGGVLTVEGAGPEGGEEGDRITGSAGCITLLGQNVERPFADSGGAIWEETQAFLIINGVGLGDENEVSDELGRVVQVTPNSPDSEDADEAGRIWMRGFGIAIDAFNDLDQVPTTNQRSSFRLNRSFTGDFTDGGDAHMPIGMGSNLVLAGTALNFIFRGNRNGVGDDYTGNEDTSPTFRVHLCRRIQLVAGDNNGELWEDEGGLPGGEDDADENTVQISGAITVIHGRSSGDSIWLIGNHLDDMEDFTEDEGGASNEGIMIGGEDTGVFANVPTGSFLSLIQNWGFTEPPGGEDGEQNAGVVISDNGRVWINTTGEGYFVRRWGFEEIDGDATGDDSPIGMRITPGGDLRLTADNAFSISTGEFRRLGPLTDDSMNSLGLDQVNFILHHDNRFLAGQGGDQWSRPAGGMYAQDGRTQVSHPDELHLGLAEDIISAIHSGFIITDGHIEVLGDMDIDGDLGVGGDMGVDGDTDLGGNLDVGGDTTLGDTTINGTLDVSGLITGTGGLTISGGSVDFSSVGGAQQLGIRARFG